MPQDLSDDVKNLTQLLERYRSDDRVQSLLKGLQRETPVLFRLDGLAGASDRLIISALYLERPGPMLVLAQDKEEAAYLLNDLSSLLQPKTIRFLPDSFKRPRSFTALNKHQVQERTETINHLHRSNSGEIVVSYPEALFEKVLNPQALSGNRIDLVKTEKLDLNFLIEVLNEYGFSREDFVYEPGQFSVRGGIVDIFSYGNEYPYRVELFDDEVESLRTFDPITQLSVQNIQQVSIIPNVHTRFSEADKVSVFETLPDNTLIWIADTAAIDASIEQCFERAELAMRELALLDDPELAKVLRTTNFVKAEVLWEHIHRFPVFLQKGTVPGGRVEETIRFGIKPQPNFNKNFTLLIDDLNKHSKAGFENYLFTDNAKQVERFYSIFEDLQAQVMFHPVLIALHAGFIDAEQKVTCYTDHQIFQRFHRFKLRKGFSKDQALNLRMLRDLQPGDFVTHIDHGVGRYSGLEKININGHIQESVRLFYKNNDVLYVSINSLHKISKFSGKEGTEPQLSKLGSESWKNTKARTKKKVKEIATELIKLYAKRKASEGFAFPPDGYLQNELEASFIYEDTPDQLKATNETKEDMMKPNPMDRLICGDVGFGKTEVAVRATFKAVVGGKQVAILVPTTILALQHYKTFYERLKEFGVSVDYLNRFRTAKERTAILKRAKDGELDVLIGTHALLSKKLEFKDLGLLVVDEEQKFGVVAKERLRNIKVNVDTLTLTATPIPRTLQFSLMAARDLSVIRTPPPNRQSIHTEVRVFNEELIKEAIYYELNRGGQVFFVHNRVKSLPDITATIKRLCPDVDIQMAHGQMESKDLERTLIDFIDGHFDVLVCTNIIETGLDIPNANTMMIHQAHQFGMSDLHQLRGRVGRSNKKAFCYLLSPPMSVLTPDARKRLQTIEEFSDLGSGINIAMRDLDIRGAGNLLGGEQSGFITEIGFETYQRVLEEAIRELKERDFSDVFAEELEKDHNYVREVNIDADVEMLIPDEYVENIQERLSLYTKLDALESEEALQQFAQDLRDRFGKLPEQVDELFDGLRLRWVCRELGFERLVLKNDKLTCFFVENPQSRFYESNKFQKVLQYISDKGAFNGLRIKQSPRSLLVTKESVYNLRDALQVLNYIADAALRG